MALIISGPAQAASKIDLSGWTTQGAGTWIMQPGNTSVMQMVNGTPTILMSSFNAMNSVISGKIKVATKSDDDFVGFVLGYKEGDIVAAKSNFLVIDWRQGDQFGYNCDSKTGLAISQFRLGMAANAGSWCHKGNGVRELSRGKTLGNSGWADNTEYELTVQYTDTNVKFWVDGVLEIDLDGTFVDGRFGLYNYSQERVVYKDFSQSSLPAVPEPSTWAFLILGFGVIGAAVRWERAQMRGEALA